MSSTDARTEAMPRPSDARVDRRINTPPLCLIAFAVITFMFSLLNAGAVSDAVMPVVIAAGLIFGGITQLIAGLIQLGSGDTLNGALFSTFASFWIVLPAYLEWFAGAVPRAQAGHATGILLYTFAIVAAMFLLVSLRTNVATVLALGNLVLTLVLLGTGNYGEHSTLVHIGGITGIILAAQGLYLAAAGICEYAYGRTVIPLGPLGTQ